MSKKLVFLSIFVAIVVLIFLVLPSKKTNPPVVATPTPGSRPKTFQFDASTDLKKELDSINPQVLDSDFEEKE